MTSLPGQMQLQPPNTQPPSVFHKTDKQDNSEEPVWPLESRTSDDPIGFLETSCGALRGALYLGFGAKLLVRTGQIKSSDAALAEAS